MGDSVDGCNLSDLIPSLEPPRENVQENRNPNIEGQSEQIIQNQHENSISGKQNYDEKNLFYDELIKVEKSCGNQQSVQNSSFKGQVEDVNKQSFGTDGDEDEKLIRRRRQSSQNSNSKQNNLNQNNAVDNYNLQNKNEQQFLGSQAGNQISEFNNKNNSNSQNVDELFFGNQIDLNNIQNTNANYNQISDTEFLKDQLVNNNNNNNLQNKSQLQQQMILNAEAEVFVPTAANFAESKETKNDVSDFLFDNQLDVNLPSSNIQNVNQIDGSCQHFNSQNIKESGGQNNSSVEQLINFYDTGNAQDFQTAENTWGVNNSGFNVGVEKCMDEVLYSEQKAEEFVGSCLNKVAVNFQDGKGDVVDDELEARLRQVKEAAGNLIRKRRNSLQITNSADERRSNSAGEPEQLKKTQSLDIQTVLAGLELGVLGRTSSLGELNPPPILPPELRLQNQDQNKNYSSNINQILYDDNNNLDPPNPNFPAKSNLDNKSYNFHDDNFEINNQKQREIQFDPMKYRDPSTILPRPHEQNFGSTKSTQNNAKNQDFSINNENIHQNPSSDNLNRTKTNGGTNWDQVQSWDQGQWGWNDQGQGQGQEEQEQQQWGWSDQGFGQENDWANAGNPEYTQKANSKRRNLAYDGDEVQGQQNSGGDYSWMYPTYQNFRNSKFQKEGTNSGQNTRPRIFNTQNPGNIQDDNDGDDQIWWNGNQDANQNKQTDFRDDFGNNNNDDGWGWGRRNSEYNQNNQSINNNNNSIYKNFKSKRRMNNDDYRRDGNLGKNPDYNGKYQNNQRAVKQNNNNNSYNYNSNNNESQGWKNSQNGWGRGNSNDDIYNNNRQSKNVTNNRNNDYNFDDGQNSSFNHRGRNVYLNGSFNYSDDGLNSSFNKQNCNEYQNNNKSNNKWCLDIGPSNQSSNFSSCSPVKVDKKENEGELQWYQKRQYGDKYQVDQINNILTHEKEIVNNKSNTNMNKLSSTSFSNNEFSQFQNDRTNINQNFMPSRQPQPLPQNPIIEYSQSQNGRLDVQQNLGHSPHPRSRPQPQFQPQPPNFEEEDELYFPKGPLKSDFNLNSNQNCDDVDFMVDKLMHGNRKNTNTKVGNQDQQSQVFDLGQGRNQLQKQLVGNICGFDRFQMEQMAESAQRQGVGFLNALNLKVFFPHVDFFIILSLLLNYKDPNKVAYMLATDKKFLQRNSDQL